MASARYVRFSCFDSTSSIIPCFSPRGSYETIIFGRFFMMLVGLVDFGARVLHHRIRRLPDDLRERTPWRPKVIYFDDESDDDSSTWTQFRYRHHHHAPILHSPTTINEHDRYPSATDPPSSMSRANPLIPDELQQRRVNWLGPLLHLSLLSTPPPLLAWSKQLCVPDSNEQNKMRSSSSTSQWQNPSYFILRPLVFFFSCSWCFFLFRWTNS